MSARSLHARLQMFASHVPVENCVRGKRGQTPGTTRSALSRSCDGTVVCVPPVKVLTTLDRFILGVEEDRPDPFSRSSEPDYYHGSSDTEPTFEERDPEDR